MYVGDSDERLTEEGLSEGAAKMIDQGGVILSTRATIGKVAIAANRVTTNQGFKSIEPDTELITSEYLAYYLKSIGEYFDNLGRGATYPEITKTQVQETPIPLPPLEEQERLVSVLDKVFDATRRIDSLSEKTAEYTTEFANAMSHATLGPENIPDHWEIAKLNGLSTRRRSTVDPQESPKKSFEYYSFPNYDEDGIPGRTVGEEIGSRKRQLQGGELLISRLNPRIPRVWLVNDTPDAKIASTEFVAVEIDEEIASREFVQYFFSTDLAEQILCSKVTGAVGSRSRVSYDDVMNVEIPIPPEEEQKRIIEVLDDVTRSCETTSSKQSDGQSYGEELKDAVLAQAFTGQLSV
jgi:type I restriction enzyme S subunit